MIDEKRQEELRKIDQDLYESPSLLMFTYDGAIRKLCTKIIEHRLYERIMFIFTIGSSIQLGIDNPLNDPDSLFSKIILIIDYILTCIFGIDIMLKIIVHGALFCGQRSFLKHASNVMDVVIVIISVSSNQSMTFLFYRLCRTRFEEI